MGAYIVGKEKYAEKLLKKINKFNDETIISACNLVGFDVYCRTGKINLEYKKNTPDQSTINNIRIMVKRCLNFYDEFGPMLESGFNFEKGYTDIISTGDGDIMSENALWDIKTSKNPITKNHTF